MFKEPVAQHMLARSTEFQSKSYIASESCFGGIVLVAVIPLPLREFVMVRCGMPPAFHRRCWGHLRPAHCKLIRSLGREVA
jgi:hypothetical protein